METSFWIERWREGRIAFHEGRPNAYLARHLGRLGPSRRVLVPLCGKSEDMAHLAAAGHQVIGVELVEDAVRAFFAEHEVDPAVREHGPFTAYEADRITLLAGDWFAATPELVGPVDALYDRAALVALPSEMRARYVAALRALVPKGSPGIVVTLEYYQARIGGPPFSVPEGTLRSLFDGLDVQLLDEGPADVTRFLEAGIAAVERCFLIRF
ncbi:thiopurine S-methyltransferase [Pendulispora albinea]|uniref:thiopurine S-methyltransferase n=1 Tax=Pendulispora albinea TaxID=2741071 RepID=A0ABZ2M437_9BACT